MNDFIALISGTFAFSVLQAGFCIILLLYTILGILACRHDRSVLLPMLGFFLLQIPLFYFALAAAQLHAASLIGLLICVIAGETLLFLVGRRR